LDILDVAPTLLQLYGQPIPPDMQGKPLALQGSAAFQTRPYLG
jgi:bisphosphoglycerate-independent phosphoglycerate mutase (AlkP superfamily)